jgi:RNA polymerase sigma-70 factor (ECF subfamily)
VQDAFTTALVRWPVAGIPDNPGAWIVTTARNRAIDRLRRERVLAAKLVLLEREAADEQRAAAVPDVPDEPPAIGDDRLRLIFTCCHPALSLDAQVALTLRLLGGLDVAQIARAFLVSEQAIAQRLVRAKAKIRTAAIPFRVPPDHLLGERRDGVMAALYLIFNEGYAATAGGDLVRRDLCREAIRLSRLLARLMPDEPEALGLLALMLLQDSRREARCDARGEPVLLQDQDRSRWDRISIAEGMGLVERALRLGPPGAYTLQAAVAALHAAAPRAADTDWAQIAQLYAVLERVAPSPVVTLNRAVAVAMAHGAAAGLELVAPLAGDGPLEDYPPLHVARGHLLAQLGRREEAAGAYARAAALERQPGRRAYLERRRDTLQA